jgi:hypothetical protein
MPTPYYTAEGVTLHLGDSLDILPALADNSVDAVVTDPPYELAFMGKAWDASGIAYNVDLWQQCWRVLKPGGHLLAFGGTRTYHRMTVAIEDAGFEIRDSLHWIYGSGFPKGQDVSKAIDKAAGAERKVIGDKLDRPGYHLHGHDSGTGALGRGISATTSESRLRAAQITAPSTESAARWQGWDTALKPAHEPIALARKAMAQTVAANVLEHGTGALNIAACRTAAGQDYREKCASVVGVASSRNGDTCGEWTGAREDSAHAAGRWPTNILLCHGPDCINDGACQPGCPVADMDRQSGMTGSNASADKGRGMGYHGADAARGAWTIGDSGGASRFFPVFRYEAKAPASERPRLADGTAHTTVKPLALMQWLVRLVTPPGGTVLDPFAGSGTTLEASVIEGFNVIGVEREEPYAQLCVARLSKPIATGLFAI